MATYKLTNEAKSDLIRIHQYGVEKFGMTQADKYFECCVQINSATERWLRICWNRF